MKKKNDGAIGSTMLEVAGRAGVSAMTVSRVLRNPQVVSAATRIKVRKAIEELDYVPDQAAGALSSGRSGFIACIVPSLDNSNFAETVRGISEELSNTALQLLLGYTNYSVHSEENLVRTMLQRRPEAIILTGGDHTDRTRRLLELCEAPVIQMWDTPAKPLEHVVGFSNADACGDLVVRLHECGYRNPGFIGGTTNRDTRGTDRREGFITATKALGLPADRIISSGIPPISMQEGAHALVQMLERWPDTDAVVCVSDLSAFGAITECRRRGWSVPERVAIAGFGDFEIAANNKPSISTVYVNSFGLGESVGRIVKQAIASSNQGNKLAPQFVTTEYRVVLRESTAS